MAHSALTPVFQGLRIGLHVLVAALSALVALRAVLDPVPASGAIIVLAVAFLLTYAAGALLARAAGRRRAVSLVWLAVVTLEWIAMLWLTPEAAYLVFPLFFLFLHLLGGGWGSVAVAVATVWVVCGLAARGGWSLAGLVGPVVGAGVALLLGLGYRALAREAEQREALMRELLATRGQLAASEHEAGVLAERARLAREIHDTVAQGLSSIQMLLHAAERTDPECAGVEHIRLARETAASNLADARRFIRELTPPDLDDEGLGGALRRLAASQWSSQGLTVHVRVSDAVALPMHLQTALLRIAQGAIANVIQHADAESATITLAVEGDRVLFSIADDGDGFDPALARRSGRSDSFGLRAARDRVAQLGGALAVDSRPGEGTTLAVDLPAGGAA